MSTNGPEWSASNALKGLGHFVTFGVFKAAEVVEPTFNCPEGFNLVESLESQFECVPVQQQIAQCPDVDAICKNIQDRHLYELLSQFGFDRNDDGIITAEEVIETVRLGAKQAPGQIKEAAIEFANQFKDFASENPLYATGYAVAMFVGLTAGAAAMKEVVKGLAKGLYAGAGTVAYPVTAPCSFAYNKACGKNTTVKAIEGPKAVEQTTCEKIAAISSDHAAVIAQLTEAGVRYFNNLEKMPAVSEKGPTGAQLVAGMMKATAEQLESFIRNNKREAINEKKALTMGK